MGYGSRSTDKVETTLTPSCPTKWEIFYSIERSKSSLSNLPHSKRINFFSGGVRGGSVHLLDLTEETPHYVRGDKRGKQRRLLAKAARSDRDSGGDSSLRSGWQKREKRRLLAKSARSDTFWNEGYAPFPTFPQKAKMIFISSHPERSEGSPNIGKGKRPLPY